jgi:hypothetical protein
MSSVEGDPDVVVELGVVDWALAWESRLRRLVDDEPGATLARCPGCGLRRLEWEPRAAITCARTAACGVADAGDGAGRSGGGSVNDLVDYLRTGSMRRSPTPAT